MPATEAYSVQLHTGTWDRFCRNTRNVRSYISYIYHDAHTVPWKDSGIFHTENASCSLLLSMATGF